MNFLKFRTSVVLGAVAAALSLGALNISVSADETCGPTGWLPDIGQPGTNGNVFVTTEYNGDLIAGGLFSTAGGQTVNNIARWDGNQWHPLSSGGQIGVTFFVNSLTVYNGDLIAGGGLTTAGGQTVNRIARWDGEAWHPLSSGGQIGVNGGSVNALTVHNGDLIVGGGFTTAGGMIVNHIARWDGEQWFRFTSEGQLGVDGAVNALTVYNGDLIAGGLFITASGKTMNRIARWDGLSWDRFNSGGQTGVSATVSTLTVYRGDLIVGGQFPTAGGQTVNRIARWDGGAWNALSSGGQVGMNNVVNSLGVYNGSLLAGGPFITAGGQTVNRIARWDGEAWNPFSSGAQVGVGSTVNSLTVYNGSLVAAGAFTTVGSKTANRIARWSDGDAPRITNRLETVFANENETVVFTLFSSQQNPDSCAGFCGDQAPSGCWCDEVCVEVGDCCFDSCLQCSECELEPSYQWRKNGFPLSDGGDISGANSPTLTIANVSFNDAAAYDVRVQNQCGTVFSNPAALLIGGTTPPPPSCTGDLNSDGVVNFFDLLMLLDNWGSCR